MKSFDVHHSWARATLNSGTTQGDSCSSAIKTIHEQSQWQLGCMRSQSSAADQESLVLTPRNLRQSAAGRMACLASTGLRSLSPAIWDTSAGGWTTLLQTVAGKVGKTARDGEWWQIMSNSSLQEWAEPGWDPATSSSAWQDWGFSLGGLQGETRCRTSAQRASSQLGGRDKASVPGRRAAGGWHSLQEPCRCSSWGGEAIAAWKCANWHCS